MIKWLGYFFEKCICFVFPPICLYCKKMEKESSSQFCSFCIEKMLSTIDDLSLQKESQIIVFFNVSKIGKCLYNQMKNYRLHSLLSSFFILAIEKLNWPWPKQIICPHKSYFKPSESLFIREIKKMSGLSVSKRKGANKGPFLYFHPFLERKDVEKVFLEKDSYHFIFFLKD